MSKIALSSNEAFFFPPDRLAGKKPSSAGRDFHTSVAVVASALHGSHSNELGAGEQAAAVGAATHLLSHPGPLRPGVARNRRYFFGKSHLPASGLGFLGPAGAAAFGFPVYPAQLCRRLEGGRRASAAMPKHRRNVAVAVNRLFGRRRIRGLPRRRLLGCRLAKKNPPGERLWTEEARSGNLLVDCWMCIIN